MISPTAQQECLRKEHTDYDTWFERDRRHARIDSLLTGETIFELWDEAVDEFIEDGFFENNDWHQSLYDYALCHELLPALEHEHDGD